MDDGKFLLVEKIQILCQLTLLHQQKRKRKPNVGDIINEHCHLLKLQAIQVPMRNHIMAGLKLSLKNEKIKWKLTKCMAN